MRMQVTVGELRNIVKQQLHERAHTGRFTLQSKFDSFTNDADDAYHAAMDEFFAMREELGVVEPSDPAFIGYVVDTLKGNAPDDVISAVKTKLEKKDVKKTRKQVSKS